MAWRRRKMKVKNEEPIFVEETPIEKPYESDYYWVCTGCLYQHKNPENVNQHVRTAHILKPGKAEQINRAELNKWNEIFLREAKKRGGEREKVVVNYLDWIHDPIPRKPKRSEAPERKAPPPPLSYAVSKEQAMELIKILKGVSTPVLQTEAPLPLEALLRLGSQETKPVEKAGTVACFEPIKNREDEDDLEFDEKTYYEEEGYTDVEEEFGESEDDEKETAL